jgi:hypothetical protein
MTDTDILQAGVEASTPKMRTIVANLEQAVTELVHSAEECPSDRTIALLSIAISAKRIADGIDHICNYGVIADTEPR